MHQLNEYLRYALHYNPEMCIKGSPGREGGRKRGNTRYADAALLVSLKPVTSGKMLL